MPIEATVNQLLGDVDNVVANDFAANILILQNFLQHDDNAIIRIFVAGSNGYGHQATTVNIMRSLIDRGFNQNFYVIYIPGAGTNQTFPKLQRLLPGLTPENQNDFILNGVHCSFISSVAFNALNPAPAIVNVGFTGGYDGADNLATTYRCNYFLKLEPYDWLNHPNAVMRTGQLQAAFINLANIAALGNLPNRAYYLPDPLAPVQADFGGNNAKWNAFNDIITARTAGDVNLLPIYGIGDMFEVIEANPNVRPETNLYNLIAGVALSQDNEGNVATLHKSAVFAIIATVTEGPWGRLNTLINGEFPGAGELNTYNTETLDLANRVTIINYDAVGFNNALQTTRINANRILLVRFNGLPQPAFNYMYTQATLPSLFEGKGTANLALNINSPFLWIRDTGQHNPLYPTLPLGAQHSLIARHMGEAVQALNQTPLQTNANLVAGGEQWENSAPMLLEFILQLLHGQYSLGLADYFHGLFQFFHNEEEDKLLKATFYLLDYINAQNANDEE